VLRWVPTGLRDAIGLQLDRVITVAGQDNVTLGVIPNGDEPILPFHGFTIYADRDGDDPFVSCELVHNYVNVNDPTDIELYRDIYRRLTAARRYEPRSWRSALRHPLCAAVAVRLAAPGLRLAGHRSSAPA
jgi:Domain of unknown function (DUF5753)